MTARAPHYNDNDSDNLTQNEIVRNTLTNNWAGASQQQTRPGTANSLNSDFWLLLLSMSRLAAPDQAQTDHSCTELPCDPPDSSGEDLGVQEPEPGSES